MADLDRPSEQSVPHGVFATELGLRLVSGTVLAIIALFATYQGGWPFALLWLAAGIAIVVEWTGMARIQPLGPVRVLSGAGLAAVTTTLMGLTASSVPLGLLGSCVAGIATGLLVRGGSRLHAILGLACGTMMVLIPPLVRESPQLGLVAILWMFAVVWVTDIAAYFTGRRFGGPKLWPRVSPKKTWSGFVGGLAGGTLAGVAVPWAATGWGWAPPFGFAAIGLLSALASVVSQGGDLAESALKRHFGVKDSGRLIPGHGGVMDRLDGFWAVAALVGLILLIGRTAKPDIFPA